MVARNSCDFKQFFKPSTPALTCAVVHPFTSPTNQQQSMMLKTTDGAERMDVIQDARKDKIIYIIKM